MILEAIQDVLKKRKEEEKYKRDTLIQEALELVVIRVLKGDVNGWTWEDDILWHELPWGKPTKQVTFHYTYPLTLPALSPSSNPNVKLTFH